MPTTGARDAEFCLPVGENFAPPPLDAKMARREGCRAPMQPIRHSSPPRPLRRHERVGTRIRARAGSPRYTAPASCMSEPPQIPPGASAATAPGSLAARPGQGLSLVHYTASALAYLAFTLGGVELGDSAGDELGAPPTTIDRSSRPTAMRGFPRSRTHPPRLRAYAGLSSSSSIRAALDRRLTLASRAAASRRSTATTKPRATNRQQTENNAVSNGAATTAALIHAPPQTRSDPASPARAPAHARG